MSALARQFVWFTLAGLAGLAADAGLFALLTRSFVWGIAPARAVSVCCMVLITWVLNRAITFAAQRSPRRGAEFIRYVAVQASGLAVNIGVFALCLRFSSELRQMPLVPLVLGAAAGFAFNFLATRALVFSGEAAR